MIFTSHSYLLCIIFNLFYLKVFLLQKEQTGPSYTDNTSVKTIVSYWNSGNIQSSKLAGCYDSIFNMSRTLEYNFVHYPFVEPLVTHTLLEGFAKVDGANIDFTGLWVMLAGIMLPPFICLFKTVIFSLIVYTLSFYIGGRCGKFIGELVVIYFKYPNRFFQNLFLKLKNMYLSISTHMTYVSNHMVYAHPIEFVVFGLAMYLLNDILLFFEDLLINLQIREFISDLSIRASEFISDLPNNNLLSRLGSPILLLDSAWWFINGTREFSDYFPIPELMGFMTLLAGAWGCIVSFSIDDTLVFFANSITDTLVRFVDLCAEDFLTHTSRANPHKTMRHYFIPPSSSIEGLIDKQPWQYHKIRFISTPCISYMSTPYISYISIYVNVST